VTTGAISTRCDAVATVACNSSAVSPAACTRPAARRPMAPSGATSATSFISGVRRNCTRTLSPGAKR
jgi:hypothetical protein